jgi:hypothetical protein
MPYANVACTLLRRYEDGAGAPILRATPTCLVGASAGALPTVPLAVIEVGDGWYAAAHTFATAGDFIRRWGESSPGALDGRDDIVTVIPTIPPAVPGPAGTGGPVESRLSLDLPAAKLFLRVEHDADDDLITAFIIAAKQQADGFLNNPFTVMRAMIFVSGAAVDDSVYVDGMTFRVAATAPATRSQDFMLQEFAIGGDDEETAENLTAIINDEMYGALNVLATQSATEIALTWRTGRKEPVTASEATAMLSVRARRVQDAIPELVRTGVLRTIAWMYDQRQDGISAAAISGQGSTSYGAPPQALDLWRRYRKIPGM